MAIKEISVEEAKELMENENYTYLDVRSDAEFEQGHAAGSVNIPIKQLNPAMQMLEDNHDFVDVVEANFPKDTKFVVGCAAGHRSMMACQMLAAKGYENLINIDGGFSGKRDPFGNVLKQGWVQHGFPVEQGDGGKKGYAAMKEKAE